MSLNLNTELALVNTTATSGSISLPPASSSQGRVITFKDIVGRFGINSLTLICDGSDIFEDNSSSKILRENNGIIQVVASGTKWYVLTGTQQNLVSVSTFQSLNLSTVNISSGNLLVSSLTFSSTNTISLNSTFAIFNSNIFAGTRVYPQTTLNNYRFSPAQIPGLTLWLDAADSNTITLAAGVSTITTWRDKSEFRFDAIGYFGTGVYKPSSLSGLYPTVDITPTGNMRAPVTRGTFRFFTNGFAVFQKYGAVNASVGDTLFSRTVGNIPGAFDMYTLGGGTGRLIGTGTPPFYTSANDGSLIFRSTSATLYNFSIGSNNLSNWTESVNGTITNFTTTNAGGLTTFAYADTATNIFIGTRSNGGTTMTGYISEILFYNTSINLIQRRQIEGYLAWKWGLQSNLPANHPFRNAPP